MVLHVENGVLINLRIFHSAAAPRLPSFSHLHFSTALGKSDILYISILSLIRTREPSLH